jgi:hypothetical protein
MTGSAKSGAELDEFDSRASVATGPGFCFAHPGYEALICRRRIAPGDELGNDEILAPGPELQGGAV